MSLALRGMVTGAGFGLALAVLEVCGGVFAMRSVGIGLPRTAMIQLVGLDLVLGAILGGLAAPLLGLGLLLAGRWLYSRRAWLPAPAGLAIIALAITLPELSGNAASERTPDVSAPSRPDAPDVVLVVLDTVRADHVGAYGYPRDTTPSFDRLAAEGTIYLDATAPATWSLPSHASLFTGRFPSGHQAHGEHRYLDVGEPTLAETLAAAGYDTRCFTANAWISDTLGLTRGFAWSDEAWRTGEVGRTRLFAFKLLDRLGLGAEDKGGGAVAGNFERWAADTPAEARPTFAFLNFVEAHFPYHQVPADYLARFTDTPRAQLTELSTRLLDAQFGGEPPDPETSVRPAIDMYDAGLAYADSLVERLVGALRRRGTLDRTVLIVMSDHGELLGEFGAYGHGHSISEPESRVPLLIRYPGRVPAGTRVSIPVSTVGVYATILDLVGIEPPPSLQVDSLLPAIAGGPPGGPVISERFAGDIATAQSEGVQAAQPLLRRDVRFRSYRVGEHKFIEDSNGGLYFFDLSEDPGELENRAEQRASDVARLRSELDGWQLALGLPKIDAPVAAGGVPELDADARERLKALGYLE